MFLSFPPTNVSSTSTSLPSPPSLLEASTSQGHADAMQHEPRGLLRHADCAVNFVGTNAVFAVGNHPHSGEPLVQADRDILEDRADLDGELAASRCLRLALPQCGESR